MIRKIVTWFFFFCLHTLYTQNKKTDSLLRVLNSAGPDSVKAQALGDISWEYVMTDAVKSKQYARQETDLAQKIHHKRLLAQGYNDLGTAFIRLGMPDSALEVLNKSLAIRKTLHDDGLLASSLSKIAIVYIALGKHKEALNLQFELLRTYERLKNITNQASTLNNISASYNRMNDPRKSLYYAEKALALHMQKNDEVRMAEAYFNIANIYVEMHSIDKAREYLGRALYYSKRTNNRQIMAYVNGDFGVLEKNEGRYMSALSYFRQSYQCALEENNKQDILQCRQQLITILIDVKDYAEAEKLALENQRSIGTEIKPRLLENYRQLALIYARTNKGELAETYIEKFSLLKDSMYSQSSAEEIANAEKKYETEKKESENKLLKQQNDIKSLEIENNAERIKIKNQTIFILIALMVVALIIVSWQLSLARIKKQRRQLEEERKLQQDRERISRDLHDNVGGHLSYILFSLEGEEEKDAAGRKEKTAQLASAVRDVTSNLREAIWALNREHLTLRDISDKLKVYAKTIFSYSSVKIRFEEKIDRNALLDPTLALNIFRICQEAVNNVFKHAGAKELLISFDDSSSNSKIIIRDDGHGIRQYDNKQTFGLSGLKKRAEEIGARLGIESEAGKGTTISIVV